MTPRDQANVSKIVQWQIEVRDLAESLGRDLDAAEVQDQINRINAQLDPVAGIVAGDGCYYPRRAPDGSDPFNL